MTIRYPDVSHYQAGLQIQPGTPALCAKATEGSTLRDAAYASFQTQAAAKGVYFFAYHWLHHGGADAQAQFCHGVVGRTPVMVDCEDTGDTPTVDDCVAFARALRARGGVCTLAYLPRWYWRDHLGSPSLAPLTANRLNLVSSMFTTYSDTGAGWAPYGGVAPVIWQYADSYPYGGQTVDANAYRGTAAQLRALVSGSSPQEVDVPHLDLELNIPKVLTSPTVVGGAGWVCVSCDFGDARVRVAIKHSGKGWEIHDNVAVTSTGDHVVVAKIDSTATKISAYVASRTTTNTAVALDVLPDHPY